MKKLLSILASIGIIATLFTGVASAEDAVKPAVWLQISPVSNRIALESGSQLEYSFNVENIGSEAFSYNVYAAPYSVTDGSYELNFSEETPRTQLSRWVTFKNAEGNYVERATYTIQPGEKQPIDYRVTVPADIPEGGQYATIFAESNPDSTVESSGIKTVSRVGLVLYGRTNGATDEAAEINDLTLATFLTKGTVKSSVSIKNSGNTDFETRYNLIVKSLFGKVVYDNTQDRTNIYDVLPDTKRDVTIEWKDTPAFGIFHATVTVSALGQTEEISRIILIMPAFVIVIMVLLLTILIIWLTILVRKRKAQKSRLIV